MTLDQLFSDMKRRGAILVSPVEIWEVETSPRLRYEFRKHSEHIAQLMRLSDIRVCASRDLHRAYWKRVEAGRYACEICQRIAV